MTKLNERKKVAIWVRCFALTYFFCLVFASWFALQHLLNGLNIPLPGQSEGVIYIVLFVYMSFLFCYVAITGYKPTKYFPIGNLSWPLDSYSNPSSLRVIGLKLRNRNR